MTIYTFKSQFEQTVKPGPAHRLIHAEQAWAYLKETIHQPILQAFSEELGFSMSTASYSDGHKVQTDENLFQIYFGRLIDAVKGSPWHTAEIYFYYRYEMNARLRDLLSALQPQDVETAFLHTEDEKLVCQKMNAIFAFADQQQLFWDEVRELSPVVSSFEFLIT
jgi:hypothetical protein